jgi:hypothetical protein
LEIELDNRRGEREATISSGFSFNH